jgi:hypothetical protein
VNVRDTKAVRIAPLETPTDLESSAVRDLAGSLNILLADMFGLYLLVAKAMRLAHVGNQLLVVVT